MTVNNVLRVAREDLEKVLEELSRIYSSRSQGSEELRPSIRTLKGEIKGYPVKASRLRSIEPIPHRRPVLAVDASLKILFDLGSCKVLVARVVAGIWRGASRLRSPEPVDRMTVAWSKDEAADWLLRIELKAAIDGLSLLGWNGICLLDRGLIPPPKASTASRLMIRQLISKAEKRHVLVAGFCKKSGVKLASGESLIGYVSAMADRILPETAWLYHPVFPERALREFGCDLAVVKLDCFSDTAFRADLANYRDLDWAVSELAYLGDDAAPGYPYPLRGVHEEAKISREELELLRSALADLLKEEGVLSRIAVNARVSGFKERYLWGW